MWRYVHARGQTYGPADMERLLLWVREGRVGPDDWVWIDEERRWVGLRDLPDLAAALSLSAPGAPGLAAPSSTAPPSDHAVGQVPQNLFAFEGGRRYVRFDTHLKARYAVQHMNRPVDEKSMHACTLSNLSVGGAGIDMVETLSVGTVLRVVAQLPDEDPEPFTATVRILRTAPSIVPGHTEHGTEFSNLPGPLKDRLVAFLEEMITRGETGR